MNLAQRLEAQLPRFPAALRAMFEAEIAAGNELRDVEVGRGPDEGKTAIILYRPFRAKHDPLTPGVTYRELLDRDPMLYGYFSADDRFSVLWVKFKPVVFAPITGPKSPDDIRAEREAAAAALVPKPPPEDPDAEAERAKQLAAAKRASRAASKRAERATRTPSPKAPAPLTPGTPDPSNTPGSPDSAAARFLASMTMTFDMWHDGLGYDLEALDAVPESEKGMIEHVLLAHTPCDWRDIEALARLNTTAAIVAIEAALKSTDPKVRREAMKHSGEKSDPDDREKLLIKGLENDDLFGGLSDAIDEAEEFHPPAVVDALFRGALNRDGQAAVHFAALLFFIHGKSAEAFDWSNRPFFLRFNTADRKDRKAVFRELCDIVGVDPNKYM